MRSRILNFKEIDKPIKAKPFVKWVGGKTQLLPELRARIPSNFSKYFEPFMGGGALFFHLQPEHSTLIDINRPLARIRRSLNLDQNCTS